MLICLTVLVSAGCYKDKGNYDLWEINKISMAAADGKDTVITLQFDTVRLKTVISQTKSIPEDKLTYRWSAYLYTAPLTGVIDQVLSTEKDLKVAVGLRPDKYTLLYTVTDTQTGVSYFKKFYMEVNTVLSEGWLLIGEKQNGNRDVDLLNGNGTVVRNIYSGANGGQPLPQGAHSVKVLATFFASAQNIVVLGEDDAVRVNYSTFARVEKGKDWFVQAPAKIRPESYQYNKFGVNTFFVTDGTFYGVQFETRFGAPAEGNYSIAKYIYSNASSNIAFIYDNKSQRFLNYSSGKISTFSTPVGAPFNLNEIGKELIYAGEAPGDNYNWLFKNNAEDKFYVYRLNGGAAPATKIYDINNAIDFKEAKNYAFSSLYLHMYYTVGNKVYLLDIEANSSKLIYTFPQGEEITTIKLKQTPSTFVSYPDNNRALAVGTYNQTEGKVYTFSINNLGTFTDDTFVRQYTGFGKPIDMEYKFRK